MLNQAKFDFSRESNLKPRLFIEIKKEYEKARRNVALSDDDLERVVAAGNGEQCPFSDQICGNCDKLKLGLCIAGYTKGGG